MCPPPLPVRLFESPDGHSSRRRSVLRGGFLFLSQPALCVSAAGILSTAPLEQWVGFDCSLTLFWHVFFSIVAEKNEACVVLSPPRKARNSKRGRSGFYFPGRKCRLFFCLDVLSELITGQVKTRGSDRMRSLTYKTRPVSARPVRF